MLAATLCAPLAAAQKPSPREHDLVVIQTLISENKFADAEQALQAASAKYLHDGGFENLRGVLAISENNPALAEQSFQAAIRHAPHLTAARLNLGRLYQQLSPQRPHQALLQYQEALRYEPANREARYQAAYLLMHERDYRRSLATLAPLDGSHPSTAILSLKLADTAALGQTASANATTTALMADANFSPLDVQEALPGLAAGKRYDLMVTMLESLRKQQPLSDTLLQALGLAYQQMGNLDRARSIFEEAFTKSGTSAATLVELANVAHAQKDYWGALGYLAHARALQPDNSEISYSYGLDCLDLSLLSEAQKAFKAAVERQPDNPAFNYAMGVLTNIMYGAHDATPYLEKYVRLVPGDPGGSLAMGIALFNAKQYDAASPWLVKAAAAPKTAAKAHYYLGRIASQQRRTEDAITEFEKSVALGPESADALASLGQVYLERKEYPRAVELLHRALALEPDHYNANYNLLLAYRRTRDQHLEIQTRHFEEVRTRTTEKSEENLKDYIRTIEARPFTNSDLGAKPPVPAAPSH